MPPSLNTKNIETLRLASLTVVSLIYILKGKMSISFVFSQYHLCKTLVFYFILDNLHIDVQYIFRDRLQISLLILFEFK